MGCKCVEEEPWVTVAESSELVLALVKIGLLSEAEKLLIPYINGEMMMNFIGLVMYIKMINFGQLKSLLGLQVQSYLLLMLSMNFTPGSELFLKSWS